MVSRPDRHLLSHLAGELEHQPGKVGGFTDIECSWQSDSPGQQHNDHLTQAAAYGLTSSIIPKQVAVQVNGIPEGIMVPNLSSITVWVRLQPDQRSSAANIAALNITAPDGRIVPVLLYLLYRRCHPDSSPAFN